MVVTNWLSGFVKRLVKSRYRRRRPAGRKYRSGHRSHPAAIESLEGRPMFSGLAPTISGLSPDSGSTAGGNSVIISGSNFTSVTTMMVGGSVDTSYTVYSSTQISMVMPAHSAGTVAITVVTEAGSSAATNNDLYTFQTPAALPTVTNVSPGTATTTGGASVTITGTNFTGVTGVSFGGTAASGFSVTSPTTISAMSPTHASGQVNIQVTNATGTSATNAGDELTFTTPVLTPAVTGLSSSSGPTAGGSSITITGANFTNVTQVSFGGIAANSFTVNSSNSITATVPAGSVGTVNVTVTNSAGASGSSQSDQYTYASMTPIVTGLSVTSGSSAGGTSVTITGSNFTGAGEILFGTTAAAGFSINSPGSITAISPAGSTSGAVDIRVESSYGTSATSSADQFTYTTPSPTVTGLSVSSGPTTGGTSVTVSGTNLSTATGLMFGAVATSSFTVNANGTITGYSPAESAGAVNVTVISSSGTSPASSADQFTFVSPTPVVTSLSVSNGSISGGNSVTITGSNFSGSTTVAFGATLASSFTIYNNTTIVATAPAESAGAVNVTVTNSSGASATSSADQYSYVNPAPSISSLSVTSGSTSGGASVVIQGSYLAGATSVMFGTIAATSFSVNANGTISAVSPAEPAATVNVTVITSSGTSPTSSADQFQFVSPLPVITGLSTTSGRVSGGTQVTITGSHFTGATAVKFGTIAAASYTVTNDGSIVAVSPAESAAMVDISVTTAAGVSTTCAADKFTFASEPPLLTGLNVTSGSVDGNTTVTISGSRFSGATAVDFGNDAATSFTVASDGTITAVAPAQSAGVVDVTVANGDGVSALSSADHFTYVNLPPVVSGLSVTTGSTSGSTSVTITGSHFTDASAVTVGSVAATSFTINNDGSITAVVAAQPAGTVDVTVTNAGGVSAKSTADQFTFAAAPPSVTGLSVSNGSLYGGTVVTIAGQNLSGATSVEFGSVAAVSFSVTNSGAIVAIAPAQSVGTVDVKVTTAGGVSTTTSTDQFAYQTPDRNGNSAGTPIIDGISANSDSTSGGTSITIQGVNFTGVTSVLFGTTPAQSFTVGSDNSIVAVSPAESAGIVNITLVSPAGNSVTSSADQFTFSNPNSVPVVNSVSQSSLASSAGNVVTIAGSNFNGATGVSIGGAPAVFAVQSGSSILAIVPSGVSGVATVSVTTPVGSSANTSTAQFDVNPVALTAPWGSIPTPTSDFVVGSTALGYVPSIGFGGSTGPDSAPTMPTTPVNSPVSTAWSIDSNGTETWGYTSRDSGMTYNPTSWITLDSDGLVTVEQFSIRQSFSNTIISSSSGNASQVFTMRVEEVLNEAIIGANGTGEIISSDNVQTTLWVTTTSQGAFNYTTGTFDTTTTSVSELGDNGNAAPTDGTSGGGASPISDTISEQELEIELDGSASQGSRTNGVTTGMFVDLVKGFDYYSVGEQIQSPTGSETDSLWGMDKWLDGDSGTYTFLADGTHTMQGGYFGSSSGNDTYSDSGNDASTTVTVDPATSPSPAASTVTEYDGETFSDTSFDEYSFSGGGNIFLASDGAISTIDNHDDTDDGHEDQQESDSGLITDVGTNADGSTFTDQDNFGDSNEDKSTYGDSDIQDASTASGGTDTLSDDATDKNTFSTSDHVTETVIWLNSYNVPTVATITDQSSDSGTLDDQESDGDTETLGTGEADLEDDINFDVGYNEQDTAADTLGITITTNGQVGPAESLNSTETLSIVDASPSGDVYSDAGTDDESPTSDNEADTSTETAATGDTAQITDTLVSTDTQTLSDGTWSRPRRTTPTAIKSKTRRQTRTRTPAPARKRRPPRRPRRPTTTPTTTSIKKRTTTPTAIRLRWPSISR